MSKSNDLIKRYNLLTADWCETIRQLTHGNNVEINSFEDEAGNDIWAVDNENVYFNEDDSYPLEELGFWDAVHIIERLERLNN